MRKHQLVIAGNLDYNFDLLDLFIRKSLKVTMLYPLVRINHKFYDVNFKPISFLLVVVVVVVERQRE